MLTGCNNGRPYNVSLKLTGCSESEFTCDDGQCVEFSGRCDQAGFSTAEVEDSSEEFLRQLSYAMKNQLGHPKSQQAFGKKITHEFPRELA